MTFCLTVMPLIFRLQMWRSIVLQQGVFLLLLSLDELLFVTYTIIQSITSSEMCSLHLTHLSAHTHLEQWAADTAAPGEQLGVRCLAQGSHLSRGQFLSEPRFEPTKYNALSIRATTAPKTTTIRIYWRGWDSLDESLKMQWLFCLSVRVAILIYHRQLLATSEARQRWC